MDWDLRRPAGMIRYASYRPDYVVFTIGWKCARPVG